MKFISNIAGMYNRVKTAYIPTFYVHSTFLCCVNISLLFRFEDTA